MISQSPTAKKVLLILLRATWLVLAVLLLGLFCAGQGPRIRELSTICVGAGCPLLAPSPADAAVIEEAGFALTQFAYLHQTFEVLVALIMLAFAAVIFLARFDDWFGILVSFTILLFGLVFMVEADNAFIDLHPTWRTPHDVLSAITATLFVLLLYLFPDGRFTPNATKYAAALLLIVGVADALYRDATQTQSTFGLLMTVIYMASLAAGLCAQIYRYRRVSVADGAAADQMGALRSYRAGAGHAGLFHVCGTAATHVGTRTCALQHGRLRDHGAHHPALSAFDDVLHPALPAVGYRHRDQPHVGLWLADRAAGAALLGQRNDAANALPAPDRAGFTGRHRALDLADHRDSSTRCGGACSG